MAVPTIPLILNGLNRSLFCPPMSIFVGPNGARYTDKYSDQTASWVIAASILIFFMKTGFLFVEVAFVSDDPQSTRRVVLAKYLDTCASGVAFYLFGYAVSGEAGPHRAALGESQDFILWFFRFTFASNTATILHGTLVGERRKLRMIALFIYAFLISGFIHPFIARLIWSRVGEFSPYRFCNGTVDRRTASFVFVEKFPGPSDNIIFFDFAGAGAVHMLGGFGGLILAIFCRFDVVREERKKKNRHSEYRPRSNFRAEDSTVLAQSTSSTASSRSRTQQLHVQPSAASSGATTASTGINSDPHGSRNPNSARQTDISTPLLSAPGISFLPGDHVSDTVSITAFDGILPQEKEEKDFLDEMYPKDESGEHMEFAALGVLILWMTFFAFNCGTVESISGKVHHGIIGRIALNMVVTGCFSGIIGVVIALFAQLRSRSKVINTNEIANCILGSLVSITGVCPFISAERAIVVGVGATAFYHIGVWIEFCGRIKDTARVFPVHGMCGLWGLLCVGILGQSNLIRQTYENNCECLQIRLPDSVDSQGQLFAYQLVGIALIIAWSIGTCFVIFFVLRLISMQPVANLVDFILVDFLDYYLCICAKMRKQRYNARKTKQKIARQQADDRQAAALESDMVAEMGDISKEEMFVFHGSMLLTAEDEYGQVLG